MAGVDHEEPPLKSPIRGSRRNSTGCRDQVDHLAIECEANVVGEVAGLGGLIRQSASVRVSRRHRRTDLGAEVGQGG